MIYTKTNNFLIFLILALTAIGLNFLLEKGLNMDELVFNSLGEKFTKEQIIESFGFYVKWNWVVYIIIPLYLLLKVVVISFLLDAGMFFYDENIKYNLVFNSVVKSEFVFLIILLIKFIWFYLFKNDYNLDDVQNFYPLSILSLFDRQSVKPWFVYPLQILNLFELAYWIILAYLLAKEMPTTTKRVFAIVASSYGIGLLIWVVAVMFFILNMS